MNVRKGLRTVGLFTLLALFLVGGAGAHPAGSSGRVRPLTPEASWQIEVVYEYGGSYPSLALDAAGQPRIAFFGHDGSYHYGLFFAHYEQFAWQVDMVDDNGNGSISLVIDTLGEPHISYHGSSAGQDALMYAHYYDDSWHIQTVDNDISGISGGTSLQLDAAGLPHVLYRDDANTGIKYARRTGGGSWEIETVVTMAGSGYSTQFDLALDATNWPHLSYYDYELHALRYGYKDAGGWHFETVDDQNYSTGEDNSIVLDAQGRPHISYRDLALKYARYDGSGLGLAQGWQITVVDNDFFAGTDTSLALDSGGRPHISYADWPHPDHVLQHAYFDGFDWQVETVDLVSDSTRFEGTSLALDAADQVHIAYEHIGGYELKYAVFREPCTPVNSASIRGPERLPLGTDSDYQATYTPADASTPVLYNWSNGATAAAAVFSWTLTGTFSVQVTATNACGQVQDSLAVEVFCQALEGVEIEGPPALLVDQSGIYQAMVQPITASLPLTLTWSNGSSGPAAGYSWPATGTYTLSVTATNACGIVHTASRQVEVLEEWPFNTYLPFVIHGAQP